jgi:cytidylate kinase
MSITIISGTPGSGKTSLARALAAGTPNGVHIETDAFFRFLAHGVDPSAPESRAQNSVVIRAYLTAALEYSNGGYAVYLDGVVGPWMLPLITSIVPDCDYVLLHASLDAALDRTRKRTSQPSARPAVVARMHEQFSNTLKEYRTNVIHTDGKTVEQVVEEYRAGKAAGAYSLRAPKRETQASTGAPLALDSSRWRELKHSFGSAEDVPQLIRALGDAEDSAAARAAWDDLWTRVHHQGDTYSACFATLPHIVRIALEGRVPCSWEFFGWPASVEVRRLERQIPVEPADLVPAYEWALSMIPRALQRHSSRPWDHVFTQAACAALAAAQGQAQLADVLLELGPSAAADFMKWLFGEPGERT